MSWEMRRSSRIKSCSKLETILSLADSVGLVFYSHGPKEGYGGITLTLLAEVEF